MLASPGVNFQSKVFLGESCLLNHRGVVKGISWLRRILVCFLIPKEKEKHVAVDMGELQQEIWQTLKECHIFEGKVISNNQELLAWGSINPEYVNSNETIDWEIRLVASDCGKKLVCTILRGAPHGVVSLYKAICPKEIKLVFAALFQELSKAKEE